ncbi:DUF305 domain-containing protein [Aliifodinibius sp. 1BSP15-2V2]|uniref:DUF305 domain-containing protein n=1 Tax=Fodinibius salsisoli TaxID=2820877 RepID=A0ABT3PSW2_9BACT|nr:DUF305 domain-containing protein [Fodinibius salsisoli]
MRKNYYNLLIKGVACLFVLLGAIACKSSDTARQSTSADNQSSLEELYWARQDSARMAFTKADVKFMTGMIAHHAQALIMSRLAPTNGASSSIQTLASRIINSQKDEIATMQQWLRVRDQAVPQISFDGLDMTIMLGGEPFTSYRKMRGVLSQAQLEKLGQAHGKEFDRLFLKQMIEHHAGAVFMVENLFATDGAAQGDAAFRLASNIQVDQRTEIDRMRQMLNRLTQQG